MVRPLLLKYPLTEVYLDKQSYMLARTCERTNVYGINEIKSNVSVMVMAIVECYKLGLVLG